MTQRRLKRFVERFTNQIRRLYKKLRQIEVEMDPLVDHVSHTEEELHNLEQRVDRLEKKR